MYPFHCRGVAFRAGLRLWQSGWIEENAKCLDIGVLAGRLLVGVLRFRKSFLPSVQLRSFGQSFHRLILADGLSPIGHGTTGIAPGSLSEVLTGFFVRE